MTKSGPTNPLNLFEDWGISAAVASELQSSWKIKWLRFIAGWSMYLVMIVGFAIGTIWIWPASEQANIRNAEQAASSLQAVLFDYNFGWGLLVLLFAWVVLSASIVGIICRSIPMPFKGAFFLGLIDDANLRPQNSTALKLVLQKPREYHDADALVNEWVSRYVRLTAKYAVPLAIAGSILLSLDVTRYSAYSTKGYHQSAWLPWSDPKFTPWTSVEKVQLGCNQTRDGSSLVYKIDFRDGSTTRIEDAIPTDGRSWLDGLEAIDDILVVNGSQFERWKWLDRDPLHPQCLRGYYGQLGAADGDRLRKLLRVGEFSGD